MAEYSRNPDRDAHSDRDDEEVNAASGSGLMYRRSEPPSGGGLVAANLPMQAHYAARPSAGLGAIPADAPGFDSETSGESVGLWAGAYSSDVRRLAPSIKHPSAYDDVQTHRGDAQHMYVHPSKSGNDGGSGVAPPGNFDPFASDQYIFQGGETTPRFFAPFGIAGNAHSSGLSSYDGELEDSDTPCVATLPSTFRLERTNLVVTSPLMEQLLSVDSLLDALRAALTDAGVDVLDFKPAHCVLECSYHVGNRFLSLFIRVFKAPDRASGQLFDNSSVGNNNNDDGAEQTPYLVEAQLREGDRLHFSALFREILRAFMNQEGVNLVGTFRYKPRTYPATGEGLALEQVNMAPSRNSIRLLAERGEATKTGGSLPVPASMARPQVSSSSPELDSDMMDDVVLLADMLSGSYLDVQADAAAAVAGLTTDVKLLEQLSRGAAANAANAIAHAAARLLVETRHRPARRQAAVAVANLTKTPQLRAALLASDPPAGGGGFRSRVSSTDDHHAQQRRLVESLVVLSMGRVDGSAARKSEEEIGMRRECMRALVGLAESRVVRDMPAMRLLLSTDPSGRGAKDATLTKRLEECREILRSHA
ncbi:unnamed protein product [Ectocarpus sp. CCAP 1310/34]|nr:unnamed protein product [Ectocarpus sp. CCAP 1310/34]